MSPAEASDGLLSIGEVLHLLKADFDDVTISKIRYLGSEGLVAPARTPSGYRKFTPADVERLRYVLRMQREHYLPLKVIREHLTAIDQGLAPPPLDDQTAAPRALVAAEAHPAPDDLADGHDLRLSRKELLEQSGLSNEVMRELESFGLVSPVPGSSAYDAAALQVARIAADMAQFGYGPRHLRPFKLAADREVGLVEQVVKPIARGRQADAAERAQESARTIAALAIQLHVALVKAGLARTLGH